MSTSYLRNKQEWLLGYVAPVYAGPSDVDGGHRRAIEVEEYFYHYKLMTNRHLRLVATTDAAKTSLVRTLIEGYREAGVSVTVFDVKNEYTAFACANEQNDSAMQARWEMFSSRGLPVENKAYDINIWDVKGTEGLQLAFNIKDSGSKVFNAIFGLNASTAQVTANTVSCVLSWLHGLIADKRTYPNRVVPKFEGIEDFVTACTLALKYKDDLEEEGLFISQTSLRAVLGRATTFVNSGEARMFSATAVDYTHFKDKINVIKMQNLSDIAQRALIWLFLENLCTRPEIDRTADKVNEVVVIEEFNTLWDAADKVLKDKIKAAVRLVRSRGIKLVFVGQDTQGHEFLDNNVDTIAMNVGQREARRLSKDFNSTSVRSFSKLKQAYAIIKDGSLGDTIDVKIALRPYQSSNIPMNTDACIHHTRNNPLSQLYTMKQDVPNVPKFNPGLTFGDPITDTI